jgi:CubicO group peptidase (beta-lactamase class C family)
MLNAANWTARLNELATEANVPGAALGIWSDGQEILAAHGVLNAGTQVPVTTDSVFQVGSITKIWTATMIMQLVDEGLLSLDTTVSAVLPGARLGAADVGGQVTVRHLRSRDDEPWAPVSFGQLADGTPYLYMSGRVAPRVS